MSANIVIHLDYQIISASITIGRSLNSIVSNRLSQHQIVAAHQASPEAFFVGQKASHLIRSGGGQPLPSLLRLLCIQSSSVDKFDAEMSRPNASGLKWKVSDVDQDGIGLKQDSTVIKINALHQFQLFMLQCLAHWKSETLSWLERQRSFTPLLIPVVARLRADTSFDRWYSNISVTICYPLSFTESDIKAVANVFKSIGLSVDFLSRLEMHHLSTESDAFKPTIFVEDTYTAFVRDPQQINTIRSSTKISAVSLIAAISRKIAEKHSSSLQQDQIHTILPMSLSELSASEDVLLFVTNKGQQTELLLNKAAVFSALDRLAEGIRLFIEPFIRDLVEVIIVCPDWMNIQSAIELSLRKRLSVQLHTMTTSLTIDRYAEYICKHSLALRISPQDGAIWLYEPSSSSAILLIDANMGKFELNTKVLFLNLENIQTFALSLRQGHGPLSIQNTSLVQLSVLVPAEIQKRKNIQCCLVAYFAGDSFRFTVALEDVNQVFSTVKSYSTSSEQFMSHVLQERPQCDWLELQTVDEVTFIQGPSENTLLDLLVTNEELESESEEAHSSTRSFATLGMADSTLAVSSETASAHENSDDAAFILNRLAINLH